MKTYLIRFRLCNYYGGRLVSSGEAIRLVYADSYYSACQKIQKTYEDTDNYENLTIE